MIEQYIWCWNYQGLHLPLIFDSVWYLFRLYLHYLLWYKRRGFLLLISGESRNCKEGLWHCQKTIGIARWVLCHWRVQIFCTWSWLSRYGIVIFINFVCELLSLHKSVTHAFMIHNTWLYCIYCYFIALSKCVVMYFLLSGLSNAILLFLVISFHLSEILKNHFSLGCYFILPVCFIFKIRRQLWHFYALLLPILNNIFFLDINCPLVYCCGKCIHI